MFFFSSRRRHTRSLRDWSSDVCSSDLSSGRAPQLLAGALVAEGAMDLFEVGELDICPWALREGVILRKLDVMATEPSAAASPGETPNSEVAVTPFRA